MKTKAIPSLSNLDLFRFAVVYGGSLSKKEDVEKINVEELTTVLALIPAQYVIFLFRALSRSTAVRLTTKAELEPAIARVMDMINS